MPPVRSGLKGPFPAQFRRHPSPQSTIASPLRPGVHDAQKDEGAQQPPEGPGEEVERRQLIFKNVSKSIESVLRRCVHSLEREQVQEGNHQLQRRSRVRRAKTWPRGTSRARPFEQSRGTGRTRSPSASAPACGTPARKARDCPPGCTRSAPATSP